MPFNKKESDKQISWFDRWVVNNRLVSVLAVIILLLLAIYLLHLTSFIFKPISALFAAVGAPVITAGIFLLFIDSFS